MPLSGLQCAQFIACGRSKQLQQWAGTFVFVCVCVCVCKQLLVNPMVSEWATETETGQATVTSCYVWIVRLKSFCDKEREMSNHNNEKVNMCCVRMRERERERERQRESVCVYVCEWERGFRSPNTTHTHTHAHTHHSVRALQHRR